MSPPPGGVRQTWEDPNHINPDLGYAGDNDPVDVVEIGGKVLQCGTVTPVRVVGTLAMIDEGEVDWKMIAINASHPAASGMNSLEDVEKAFPGELDAIREWFRTCECGDSCGVPRPSSNYSSASSLCRQNPRRQACQRVWLRRKDFGRGEPPISTSSYHKLRHASYTSSC